MVQKLDKNSTIKEKNQNHFPYKTDAKFFPLLKVYLLIIERQRAQVRGTEGKGEGNSSQLCVVVELTQGSIS